MKKWYLKLSVLLLGITCLFIGKNVYAFDNDQSVSVQAVNRIGQQARLNEAYPFSTSVNWVSMTQNYVYGGFQYPVNGNEFSYIRALGGSFYSNYEPNKNYHIEIDIFHGRNFYSGQYGQGKVYTPSCSLQVSQGGISNVSCGIEQNTYVGNGIYYDRIVYHFKTSNNTYSNVLWTWQFGEISNNAYILINLLPGSESEDNYIGWSGVYMGYDDDATDQGIGGVISSLDRNNTTQQQTNTILGQIRELISNFKNSVEIGISTITGKLNDIISSIGQTIGSTISNIWSFISSNVLGLDDIDDTLQDFVDSIDDNGIMGDIHDFLLLPVTYLNSIRSANSYCTNLSFTIWNKEIIIPSGCFFWERLDVRQFRTLWNTLFGGAIIFSLGFKYFKVLHNALDPTKDDLGGLQV